MLSADIRSDALVSSPFSILSEPAMFVSLPSSSVPSTPEIPIA